MDIQAILPEFSSKTNIFLKLKLLSINTKIKAIYHKYEFDYKDKVLIQYYINAMLGYNIIKEEDLKYFLNYVLNIFFYLLQLEEINTTEFNYIIRDIKEHVLSKIDLNIKTMDEKVNIFLDMLKEIIDLFY